MCNNTSHKDPTIPSSHPFQCYINSPSLLYYYRKIRNPDANPNPALHVEGCRPNLSNGIRYAPPNPRISIVRYKKPKRTILHILLGYRHITVTIMIIIALGPIYAMTNLYAARSDTPLLH